MADFDQDDLPSNLSSNPHFQDILSQVVSRRSILKSGAGLCAAMFVGGVSAACTTTDKKDENPVTPAAPLMGFTAVAANSLDQFTVPAGYTASVLYRWGDALFSHSPVWKGDASESGADQALQAGDNHDGMHFFPFTASNGDPSSDEGLLVMNHEYTNYEYLFKPVDGQAYLEPWSLDKVRKAQHAHGVSVIHIKKEAGSWKVVVGSVYNRRIHGNTPMLLTGPAAGHASLQTTQDPTGSLVYGTLNNCANGYTPWGTYLTCEENFNGYFGTLSGSDSRNTSQKRYGLNAGKTSYRWEEFDNRFDYVKEPNEANRFGWVVEIDPWDPTSTPKKRTALGRIKHENAAYTLAKDNRVVIYMGDDQANDYIYKFVSDGKYDAKTPMLNRNLLDAGKLYVAKLGAGDTTGDFMGTGEWILLDKTLNATLASNVNFATQADVLINTRLAADAVGATKMDRPEWITVHPKTGEVYCTLTNNSGRSTADEANPRAKNVYGQIIRWRELGNDAAASTFEWDLFVIAGNPVAYTDRANLKSGSSNVTVDNTFNSPDGLAFDTDGRLWIQTDGNFSNTGDYQGQGNNHMLCANPETKEIRRFLVGPSGCEITGIAFAPDLTTMFVNVQHPGEAGSHPNKPTPALGVSMDDHLNKNALSFSKWPEESGGRPRSATVVIRKNDGGKVGT